MCNGNNIVHDFQDESLVDPLERPKAFHGCFEQFMLELDSYMEERVGFTTQELNGCDYYEYYSEGLSVEECASRAVIEAEGD